ncbi:MAG: M55 family metallopeptidase [Firmicutes bacterium]|nr:M55 family metallopeptidase [Bacillota bacterium]
MKVFISSDMEGTAGIVNWWETEMEHPDQYNAFAVQMSKEVAAACQGALDAGADEVVVKDAHDSARNIDFNLLPESVKMLRGWTGDMHSMMSGIQQGMDAVMMTGYHSGVGQPENPLSHTMNTKNTMVKINGEPVSEFVLNAYMAGYYQIPVVFVSGDQGICDKAKELIPEITTVAVKEGIGAAVLSIHPALAVKKIREGVQKALSGDLSQCQVQMPEYFEMEITLREHALAHSRANYPGAVLKDSRTVAFESHDYMEIMRFMHFCL